MKRFLLSLSLVLCTICTWAADFVEGGIRYREIEYNGGTALEVIRLSEGEYAGDIVIPSQAKGMSVVKIGESAFLYCLSLNSVVIPNSVVSIGEDAFNDCI